MNGQKKKASCSVLFSSARGWRRRTATEGRSILIIAKNLTIRHPFPSIWVPATSPAESSLKMSPRSRAEKNLTLLMAASHTLLTNYREDRNLAVAKRHERATLDFIDIVYPPACHDGFSALRISPEATTMFNKKENFVMSF